jgi:zinc/manganese transport system substrate-binding protein
MQEFDMRKACLSAGLAVCALFAGEGSPQARTLNAVASFTVLADVVREVGGAHVTVKSLVGPNGDPHDFEPSPDDARTLKAADVVFVSGEGLEGWMDRLISASGFAQAPVVASEGIRARTMVDDGQTITDPHVWNDAANVVIWAKNVEAALTAADPDDAADFRANADRYTRDLEDLDAYAHRTMAAIPAARRKILTSHDAFGYFGRAYGVTFLAPLGYSTDTEASAADVAKLIGQIRGEGIKEYFLENSNDPRLIQQIAGATGAEPGGVLYVEALSAPEGPAPTYAKMFRANVDQLAAAMTR